jgi:GDP-4-dehydro-6-deoxy-D-mannose reductase
MGDLLGILAGLSRVPFRVQEDAARIRPQDIPAVVCDAGRFRSLTGWAPTRPLEETMADLLAYWRETLAR